MSFPLICMGHPLLDISSPADEALLRKYNLTLASVCLATPTHMPLYQEMTQTLSCDYTGGGSALNTCRAAAWLAGSSNFSAYFGAIGEDEFGFALKEATSKSGVFAYFQTVYEYKTGTCACLIYQKERTMVADLGASQYFKASYLQEHWEVIENSRLIYCEGFFLMDGVDSMYLAAEYACNAGKIFAINLSAVIIVELYKDQLEKVMVWTEYVFGNEEEYLKFGEVFGIDGDVVEIAIQISLIAGNTQRPKKILVTRGKDPVVVACEGKVEILEVPRIETDKVLDTNGAGDSFVGGFLFEVMNGSDIYKCVAAGNYVAGEVIQLSGCSFPQEVKKNY